MNHIAIASTLALCAGMANADYVFTFSGTITAGTDISNASLVGSTYTLTMFVLDTATDMTPTGNTGNYAIDRLTMDIGSDSTIEDSLTPTSIFSSLFLDSGTTQLAGGSDLFESGSTFMFGVFLPGNAFDDVHSLSGQANIALSGLTTSSFSFYNSNAFGSLLELDNTEFGFNSVSVVPLPPAAFAGLGMLAGLGAYRRIRR
jgi:hypothetical protein